MVSCLAAAAYTMLADVQELRAEIDPSTNETNRDWVTVKSVRCRVYAYFGGGTRGTGSTEVFAKDYENINDLRMKSAEPMNKRYRITNIRNAKSGQLLWVEDELEGQGTVFNINGSDPVTNPLTGTVVEYVSTLSRAEVF